ncbi:MAG TPA: TolC family protein [Puia sp.]|jgi:outer membrane protein|nr:TolC family protein [Puia sp.]
MRKILFLALICLAHFIGHAQDKWDLRRCVDYAVSNNISVKQTDVQARLAELTFKQYKLSQIPIVGFGGNIGYSSGQSQDPVTFALITAGLWSNQYFLQTSLNFFNFNSLKNNIAGSKFAYEAANAATDKLKNDVSLNVANAYLQALLSIQLANAAGLQVNLSQSQLDITRKQVTAGSLPELNAAEIESQLAQDSSAYVTAASNVSQAILNLKAYMSLDAAVPFIIDTPKVERIPIENIVDLEPGSVYKLALQNQPQQKADALQLQSASKYVAANKAAMLPTFSLNGQFYTTYTNQTYNYTQVPYTFTQFTGTVKGTGDSVFLVGKNTQLVASKSPYFSQLNQNFRQSISLGVNIPILNGGSLRTNYARSRLNYKNYELQQQLDNLNLKENIYQAYNLAIAALQKFESQKKTVEATQKSFEFAQKRYNVGLLNTIDLLTNQNNYFKAKSDLLYDQFDYVFKMKVLEFYKGMGIKL